MYTYGVSVAFLSGNTLESGENQTAAAVVYTSIVITFHDHLYILHLAVIAFHAFTDHEVHQLLSTSDI